MDQVTQKLLELSPTDADPTEIATEIARVVDTDCQTCSARFRDIPRPAQEMP